MECIVFAILVAIMILVILTTEKILECSHAEPLTSEECGLSGKISLPYNPLSRFDYTGGRDSGYFADLDRVAGSAADIARRCDSTPGCVAFNTSGQLKSGILPRESWQPSGGGLYVRKCAQPEPLYVELFIDQNYGTTADVGRILVPPGRYPDLDLITGLPGVIGGKMPREKLSSIKIPVGLKMTLYDHKDFTGIKLDLRHGDHPTLKAFKTGQITYPTWNDEASSIIVEYDPAPV